MHPHAYLLNEQVCALADAAVMADTDEQQQRHIRTLCDMDLLAIVGIVGPKAFVIGYAAMREMMRRSGRLDCHFPDDAFDGHAKGHGSVKVLVTE
jgi:hypothetical protein